MGIRGQQGKSRKGVPPAGSGCTYGSGSCGSVIFSWTKDAAGNIIGDFNGEELCTLGPLGSCLYWNLSSGKWESQDDAKKLATAMNKTGIQSLANPCTIGLWYAASAGAAVIGSATPAAAEAFPETSQQIQELKEAYNAAPTQVQQAIQEAGGIALLGIISYGPNMVHGVRNFCRSLQ